MASGKGEVGRKAATRRPRHVALWASAGVLACVAIAGLSAPLVAAHVLHFSVDEQHTGLRFAAPGAQDVSLDFPSWDEDDAAFDILDRGVASTCQL